MMQDYIADEIVKFTENKLKEDPKYESLSDNAKAYCLVLASCNVLCKLVDFVSKGVKEFYERRH